MIAGKKWEVSADDDGVRLDRYVLSKAATSSRALVLEAIETGLVRHNGRKTAKGAKVAAGDEVEVNGLAELNDVRVVPDHSIKLEIIHADDAILVLNKPAGMPVHPIHRSETGTLANGLVAAYPELALVGEHSLFPAMVHRLDTDTSGIVVAARTREVYQFLRAQFASRSATKTYQAIVHGTGLPECVLRNQLAHNPARRGQMLVADDPATARDEERFEAVSEVRTVTAYAAHSHVEIKIRTGVTHQIRCQLAHAGFPIAGDKVYGKPDLDSSLPVAPARHMLHAGRIELRSDASKATQEFTSEPPPDFRNLLAALADITGNQQA